MTRLRMFNAPWPELVAAELERREQERHMEKQQPPRQVAAIHTHFNIFRNVNEAHDGPVTRDEQRVAVERFVKWHQRQVEVGKALLKRLAEEPERVMGAVVE